MIRLPGGPVIRIRDFRILSLAVVFNAAGLFGEIVVLGWMALLFTDSPFLVGLALAVRWLPGLLFGIPAGAVADRFDRNVFLKLLSLGMAASSIGLGLLLLMDVAVFWHLLFFAFLSGTLEAFFQSTQQGYVHDIVGSDDVVNGIAIATLAGRIGGLLGSLVTGILTARVGPGVAMIAIAALYGLSAVTLTRIRSVWQHATSSGSVWGNLVGYFVEIKGNRTLLLLVIVTGSVEVLGFSHMALFPSLAREVLHLGPEGLGVLNATVAVGGIIAVGTLSALGQIKRPGLTFLLVLPVFGASVAVLGIASDYLVVIVILLIISAMAALSDVLTMGLMQLSVPPDHRGRAGGSWIFAIGTQPFGDLQIGALATVLGLTFALVANGLGLMVLAGVIAFAVPRLRRL